jgi:hypothetical protein
MQTQEIGNDIAADVSFRFDDIIFVRTYQFKGRVDHDPLLPGLFEVTINQGEGIDYDHAEVVVHYNSPTFLLFRVFPLPSVAGQSRFGVYFAVASIAAGPVVAFTPADPLSGSITIRRKTPSVNT